MLFDSGVRSGTDVARALALGASAVLAGKAFLWSVGALGSEGPGHAIDLFIDAVEQQTRWEWTALGRLRLRDVTVPIALCFTYDGIDDEGDAMFRARTVLSVADLATFASDLRHPSSFAA